MKASRFVELVALIGFVAGGLIAANARGGEFYLGAALAAGSVLWYFKWEVHMRGWVGPSEADMTSRRDMLARQLENLTTSASEADPALRERLQPKPYER